MHAYCVSQLKVIVNHCLDGTCKPKPADSLLLLVMSGWHFERLLAWHVDAAVFLVPLQAAGQIHESEASWAAYIVPRKRFEDARRLLIKERKLPLVRIWVEFGSIYVINFNLPRCLGLHI